MTSHPPVEYANAGADRLAAIEFADSRYDHLARPTGLPVATIRELVARQQIADLYDVHGRLLPRETLRSRFGGPPITGRQAQEVVRRKRIAPGITPSKAKRELMRLRRKGYPR